MLTTAYPKTVRLKDGQEVVIRPLVSDDTDRLHSFFVSLPEEDRMYLRDDVTDVGLVRQWTECIDFDRVIPLLALDGDEVVGDGTLHLSSYGWAQHVGQLRLVTARSFRHKGLGVVITRELVALAAERGLEKLEAHVIEDSRGAVKMFETVGFKKGAVLEGMVKDRGGQRRNLLIMVNDVSNLSRIMEDWIQDSMVPAFRVPGDGA